MQEKGYTYLRTYRYERKFMVEDLLPQQVSALIKQHPRMFISPYPPRYINNLYLDTPELVNYFDNVNGSTLRRKVRVRWYGEPFGKIDSPMLEIKLKDGVVGTKRTYPLEPFILDVDFCDRYFQSVVSKSNIPPLVKSNLRGFSVVLFNRYYRDYYATQDGAFRVTRDTHQIFYKVNGTFGNQFVHRQRQEKEVIVELKYEKEQDPHANRVAGFFPFRVTRNSKYVQGIERVYF